MRNKLPLFLVTAVLVVSSCGGGETTTRRPAQNPISIRGWIMDIEGTPSDIPDVAFPAINRAPIQYILDANVYVPDQQYVSGTIENGSFVMLDVANGDATIMFQAAGIADSPMRVKGVPPSADLVLPGIVIGKEISYVADSRRAMVRIPSNVAEVEEVPSTTFVNDEKISTYNIPIKKMGDRMNAMERGMWPTPEWTLRRPEPRAVQLPPAEE